MSLTQSQVLAVTTVSLIYVAVNLVLGQLNSHPDIIDVWSKDNVTVIFFWLGELFGYIIGAGLIEVVGRKRTLHCMVLPFLVSWILIAVDEHHYLMYAARILLELCYAIVFLCLLVYVTEITHPRVRGGCVLFIRCLWYIVDVIEVLTKTYFGWKTIFIFISFGFMVPFSLLMFFIPESPRWYVYHGKEIHAKISLEKLRSKDESVRPEWSDIVDTFRRRGLWFRKSHLRPLLTGVCTIFFQKFSGFEVVPFVLGYTYARSEYKEMIVWIIPSAILASQLIALVLVDPIGRKPLLFLSEIIMTIGYTVLGVYYYLKTYHIETVLGLELISDFSLFFCLVGFSLGVGPITELYITEIYPGKIRGFSVALTLVIGWVFDLLARALNHYFHYEPYIIFVISAGVCFVGLIFVIFAVPETKKESLEEIEKYLM